MSCGTGFSALVGLSRPERRSIGPAVSFSRRWRGTRDTSGSKNLLLGGCRGVGVFFSCPLCEQPARLIAMLTAVGSLSASHPIVPQRIWHAAYLKALVTLLTIV